MLSFLLAYAFYPEFVAWVGGSTRVGFAGDYCCHHNVIIFYNPEEFILNYDRYRHACHYTIPKTMVNPGELTISHPTGRVLRWMVMQTPLNCNTYDYFQINGNSENSIFF